MGYFFPLFGSFYVAGVVFQADMGIPQNASAFETHPFPFHRNPGCGECRNTGAKRVTSPWPTQGMFYPKPGASLPCLSSLPVSLLWAPCSWQLKVGKLPARTSSWGDGEEPGRQQDKCRRNQRCHSWLWLPALSLGCFEKEPVAHWHLL